MNIQTIALAAALAMLATPAAFAHSDAHHAATMHGQARAEAADTPFGRQGDPAKVDLTLTVDMSDNMRFTPDVLTVRRGETVRLRVANKGELLHELVLGTSEALEAHAAMMRKSPGMAHDEPQMVHVQPGRTGDVVWQFTQAGEFRFACLLPGHFEAGMVGKVVVR